MLLAARALDRTPARHDPLSGGKTGLHAARRGPTVSPALAGLGAAGLVLPRSGLAGLGAAGPGCAGLAAAAPCVAGPLAWAHGPCAP